MKSSGGGGTGRLLQSVGATGGGAELVVSELGPGASPLDSDSDSDSAAA